MLEDFGWSDDAVDPRRLRRLGVVSGSVLLAAAVLLVHEHHRGARGLSGGGLFVVWLVVVVAALLFVGAVSGFVARRAAARYRRLDPEEAHDRQLVQTLLRRGSDVPPELGEVTQRVVDDAHGRRWWPVMWVVPASAGWEVPSPTWAGGAGSTSSPASCTSPRRSGVWSTAGAFCGPRHVSGSDPSGRSDSADPGPTGVTPTSCLSGVVGGGADA